MATKGERQALLFLAAVALLGAGTRWFRARPAKVERDGLDRQIAAVEQIRVGEGNARTARRKKAAVASRTVDSMARIDLDQASPEEIERLPGLGPALARRIVGDRDANGPFGCLVALDQIKGIGPAILKRLDSLTTFSGPERPVCSGTPTVARHRQDDPQQNRDGDDDHARKLASAAGRRECPPSPSARL